VVASVVASAQVNSGTSPQTEQVETGTVPWTQAHPNEIRELRPARSMLNYRIRLLPLSSFPQLPPPVVQQLSQKGCMIPQTYEAHEPENVIQGSFEKLGSHDWAALCSIKGVTTLYVFFQSDLANPIPLRHQPDNQWLGVEWSLDYGSAWGIATRPARMLRPRASADHDGIQDSDIEQSSTIHYYDKGRWTTRDSGE
jgi:hypothetical protein